MTHLKTQTKPRRKTIKREEMVNGKTVEILYHYYPGKKPKLFIVADGHPKLSYAGTIAKNVYKRLVNEIQQQKQPARTA